jgi:hypothetical protein
LARRRGQLAGEPEAAVQKAPHPEGGEGMRKGVHGKEYRRRVSYGGRQVNQVRGYKEITQPNRGGYGSLKTAVPAPLISN